MERVLLLGAGSNRDRRLKTPNHQELNHFEDMEVETVDFVSKHNPTYVYDLNNAYWPFADNFYDEVHAYEILEHLGSQGFFRTFFDTFSNIYRILKPGGYLCATVPSVTSRWAWGDPGHRRVIMPESLVFLSQKQYELQVGKTAMSDYRTWWTGDFEPRHLKDNGKGFEFILEAIK